jgi:hypothetical protein
MINVYINGVNCPTVNDDSIVITKKILDIENPEQKHIDYSKGFLIQNTAAVTTLFGSIFEVNLEIQNTSTINFNTDFNPNLKAKCVIMNDNTVVMSGNCQMIDIVILDGNKIAYNINCYGTIGNFFNDIKNLKLSDIDFSDLDHNWTKAVIEASWTPTLGVGYTYPMINYGLNTNLNSWNVEYFRPAVFVKEVVDRIFADAGWSYSSAFFNTTRFKSLIVPFSEEKMVNDNDTIVDRTFKVGKTSLSAVSGRWSDNAGQPTLVLNTDSGLVGGVTMFNDSGTNFDTATGKWTCTANGNYAFGLSGSIVMTDGVVGSGSTAVGSCKLYVVLERSGTRYYNQSFELGFIFTGGSVTSDSTSFAYTTNSFPVDIGDDVYLIVGEFAEDSRYDIPFHSKADGDMDVVFTNLVLNCVPQPELVYADTISLNNLLPSDYTQKDFILGLSKMFNLYFEQTNDKTLLIEPREDYLTADIVDWTTKIDIGQQVKLTPMGMSQQKRYKFNYEQDTDRLNNSYFTAYKEVYGSALIDINTDFLTDTKEIKPIFAATPLSNTALKNDRIISDITFVDQNGVIKQGKSKLRILYWGGLVSCTTWTFYEQQGISPTNKTTYPYAGHLDNPKRPTFDLNFDAPYNVYYDYNFGSASSPQYTDSNLYTTYWHQTIQEISNKNSKVLEAMFYLTVFDFVTLDFRKQYFIKDAYYRLLEVTDFDVSGTKLTKCKLLKVDREAAYTTSTKVINGGNGTFDSGKKVPGRLPLNKFKDSNVFREDKEFDGGNNNWSGNNGIIKGNGNKVFSDDVFVFGSNDTQISSDRVMVFNSDSAIMHREGAMINNCLAEYKTEFTVDAAFLKAIDGGVGTDVLPELASNEYYIITRFHTQIILNGSSYSWTGTGDITLKTDSVETLMATVVGSKWLGLLQDIGIGTVTGNGDLFRCVKMSIDGTWLSGTPDVRFVIYYKIVIV